MEKLKIGIIGFGKHGSHYVRRYLETSDCKDVKLVAIAENNPARLTYAKEHLENVALFSDAIEMLDSGLIDACQIVVPHFEHFKYIEECFKRGIHVLCEKPLCVDGLSARKIIKMHDEYKDVVFGVMLNQRTNCIYRKLKELIDNNTYGKVRRINWEITDWYRTQTYFNESYWHGTWIGEGGGLFINQAIHQLDLWQWLFGMPDKVSAKLSYGAKHDIETDDEGIVYFEYKNGIKGVFISSTNEVCGVNRLEIYTEKAKILVENKKIIVNEIIENSEDLENDYRRMYKKPKFKEYEVATDGFDPKHEGVVNDFAKAILNNEELKIEAKEGLNSVILCNAIYLSNFMNSDIEIPFDEELYLEKLNEKRKNSEYRQNARDSLYGILSSYDDSTPTGYNNAIKK